MAFLWQKSQHMWHILCAPSLYFGGTNAHFYHIERKNSFVTFLVFLLNNDHIGQLSISRLLGDVSHLLAILILLLKVRKNQISRHLFVPNRVS